MASQDVQPAESPGSCFGVSPCLGLWGQRLPLPGHQCTSEGGCTVSFTAHLGHPGALLLPTPPPTAPIPPWKSRQRAQWTASTCPPSSSACGRTNFCDSHLPILPSDLLCCPCFSGKSSKSHLCCFSPCLCISGAQFHPSLCFSGF